MTRIRTLRAAGGSVAAVLASFGLAACASDVPPPTAQLGAASQSILNAEQAGAAQYAPGDLQMARDKLASANAAMRADERTQARRLAEQAQMDADLAAAHARTAAAQQAASAVQRDQQAMQGSTAPTPPASGRTYAPAAPPPAAPLASPMSAPMSTPMSAPAGNIRAGVPLTPDYRPPQPPAPRVATPVIINQPGELTTPQSGSVDTAPYGALPPGTPLPPVPDPTRLSAATPPPPAPPARLPTLAGPTSWDTRVINPAPTPAPSSGSSTSTSTGIQQQRGTSW